MEIFLWPFLGNVVSLFDLSITPLQQLPLIQTYFSLIETTAHGMFNSLMSPNSCDQPVLTNMDKVNCLRKKWVV